MGQKCHFFGVDNSFPVHVDSKKKDILVLDEGPTQELDNSMITAKARYPINFIRSGKKLC